MTRRNKRNVVRKYRYSRMQKAQMEAQIARRLKLRSMPHLSDRRQRRFKAAFMEYQRRLNAAMSQQGLDSAVIWWHHKINKIVPKDVLRFLKTAEDLGWIEDKDVVPIPEGLYEVKVDGAELEKDRLYNQYQAYSWIFRNVFTPSKEEGENG